MHRSRADRPTETGMIALIQTIILALDIYWWLIILSAIFSWLYAFNVVNPRNQFVGTIGNFLYRVTEPALRPIRNLLPDLGGIDISPIILLLIIFFIRTFIITTVAPALI
jgi:YggT family protein